MIDGIARSHALAPRVLLLAATWLLLGGCSDADDHVTVFAAASLRDVFEPLGREAGQRAGVDVRFSFAASSTLARQIEAGAPADIFVSAHRKWVDRLVERDALVSDTRLTPIGNELVLIAGAGEARARPLATVLGSLTGHRRLALGDPAHVPAGIYAQQALTALGVWQDMNPPYAFTDNVRAALALVARGEAPYGIVYATDTRVEPAVEVVGRIDSALHEPIVYVFAIVNGEDSDTVRAVFSSLTSEAAIARFVDAGFARL